MKQCVAELQQEIFFKAFAVRRRHCGAGNNSHISSVQVLTITQHALLTADAPGEQCMMPPERETRMELPAPHFKLGQPYLS